jgi:hypothetical protein
MLAPPACPQCQHPPPTMITATPLNQWDLFRELGEVHGTWYMVHGTWYIVHDAAVPVKLPITCNTSTNCLLIQIWAGHLKSEENKMTYLSWPQTL